MGNLVGYESCGKLSLIASLVEALDHPKGGFQKHVDEQVGCYFVERPLDLR